MEFVVITIFEDLIKNYFKEGVLKRAVERDLITIKCVNPRDFTSDNYNKVDKKSVGDAGMLMLEEPISKAINSIEKKENSKTIFLLPSAKKFNQKDAIRLSNSLDQIILVCGRYDGIDERAIEKYADEVMSIGDFVLSGGELASLVLIDSISRNIEGVLGNSLSLDDESYNNKLLEAPNFAKDKNYGIISSYRGGNHREIKELKSKLSYLRTVYYRPDLLD